MKIFKITLLFMLIAVYASAQERPNIVYIICDDLGFGDVQFLNPEKGKILTPEIDKLAKQGMSFTDAHAGSSVCTPSRYGVLTGRYAWRSRLQKGVLSGGDEVDPLIADKRLTVPSMLKNAGYTTAAIGKWHLGFDYVDDNGDSYKLYEGKKMIGAPVGATVPNGPITRGFDSYVGFHHSRDMQTVVKNDKVIDKMKPVQMLQFLGDHAKEYINNASNNKKPFFLYLALNSPHSPVVPSKEWQGKSGMGAYADFVMQTDDVVGQVLDALDKNGLSDNTMVFFTSDNGCSFPVAKGEKLEKDYGHFSSANFRGSKSDIWEGGHRVPFVVKWPGKIEANSESNKLICLTNLMATCAEITAMNVPEEAGEDSYSILPILKNKKAKSDHKLVVHHSIQGKFSIRKGKWKLELCPGSGGWTNPKDPKARALSLPEVQLYNLKKDEAETTNLYNQRPRLVKKLTKALQEIVDNGRTTSGDKRKNDVAIDVFKVDK